MLTRMLSMFLPFRFEGEGGGSGGSGSDLTPELAEVFESLSEEGEDGKKFVKLSQERLTKLAIASKNKAKAQATREFAEQLGMTIEEAKKLIGEHQATIEASKTETQREKDAAEKARKEAEAEKATIASERHDLRVEKALLKLGVDPAKVERVRRLVEAEVGADQDAITAAAEAVKTDFPSMFGTEKPGGGGGTLPSGGPGGAKPPGHKPEGGYDRGKARAAAYNPKKIAS